MGTQVNVTPFGVTVSQTSQQVLLSNNSRKFLQMQNRSTTGSVVTYKFDSNFDQAANGQQTITFSGTPNAGTFELTFNGYTTTALSATVSAAQVQTALQALTSIGSGNCTVTGSVTNGFVVTFTGTLASAPHPAITVTANSLTNTSVEQSAVQNISFSPTPTQGTFELTDSAGNPTTPLEYNVSTADLATALEALPNIGAGNIGTITQAPSGTFSIPFHGSLANTPVPLLGVIENDLQSNTVLASAQYGLYCSPQPLQGGYIFFYQGVETGLVQYNATAAQIHAALNTIPELNGNVTVTAIGTDGRLDNDSYANNGYEINFTNNLADTPIIDFGTRYPHDTIDQDLALHPDVIQPPYARVPKDITLSCVQIIAGQGLQAVSITPYFFAVGVAPAPISATVTVNVVGNPTPVEGIDIPAGESALYDDAVPVGAVWMLSSDANTPVTIWEG